MRLGMFLHYFYIFIQNYILKENGFELVLGDWGEGGANSFINGITSFCKSTFDLFFQINNKHINIWAKQVINTNPHKLC